MENKSTYLILSFIMLLVVSSVFVVAAKLDSSVDPKSAKTTIKDTSKTAITVDASDGFESLPFQSFPKCIEGTFTLRPTVELSCDWYAPTCVYHEEECVADELLDTYIYADSEDGQVMAFFALGDSTIRLHPDAIISGVKVYYHVSGTGFNPLVGRGSVIDGDSIFEYRSIPGTESGYDLEEDSIVEYSKRLIENPLTEDYWTHEDINQLAMGAALFEPHMEARVYEMYAEVTVRCGNS